MYRISFLLIFLCSSGFILAQNKTLSSDALSNLGNLFSSCYENKIFNGVVGVIENDEVVFLESYGFLSERQQNRINGNTPFRLASLTKQFTAVAIIQLHQRGQLQYDDRVNQYLSDFPYEGVTIRHLLNHSSGLIEYTDIFNAKREQLELAFETDGSVITNADVLSIISQRKPPLSFDPGSDFYYSNTGYLLLAQIIEKVSSQTYGDYLREHLFKNIGMLNSFVATNETRTDKAVGFEYNFLDASCQQNIVPAYFKTCGDGGVYCSMNDLIKWVNALNNGSFIAPEYLEQAYTKPRLNEKEGPYGFGYFIRQLPFNGHKALTHSGMFVGFVNSMFRNLEDGITAIVLSNNSHDSNSEINSALVRILYDAPYENPRLSAEMAIGHLILTEGMQSAKDFYRIHESENKYDFSERSINSLGYKFMRANQMKEAIDVFKWNVELHPNSSNVYDSLGEAYLQSKDFKASQLNYQKAYELDNSNVNAKKIIEELQARTANNEE